MSKNIPEIPFTELCERAQSTSRSPDEAQTKIRGTVQDVYSRGIPFAHDWDFLFASTSIVTIGKYKEGTVSVNTGATTVVFSSDAVMTTSMNGYKIKIQIFHRRLYS